MVNKGKNEDLGKISPKKSILRTTDQAAPGRLKNQNSGRESPINVEFWEMVDSCV